MKNNISKENPEMETVMLPWIRKCCEQKNDEFIFNWRLTRQKKRTSNTIKRNSFHIIKGGK